MRGEDLLGVAALGPDPLELPLALCAWEPNYAVAEYRSHDADFPSPPPPTGPATTVEVQNDGESLGATGVTRTLRDLVHPWTADGEATAVSVRGGVRSAVGALDGPEVRLTPMDAPDAFAWLGWAGASGGAHGRRRGAAAGRLDTWMILAELTGITQDWPPDASALGEAAARLRWYLWDAVGIGPTGWVLRVAVEDPERGVAHALNAHDPS